MALDTLALRLETTHLDALIAVLRGRGFRVVGPVEREGAIDLGDITSIEDLPRGRTATQEPGCYRIRDRDDDALFGWAVGPASLKRAVFPSKVVQYTAHLDENGIRFEAPEPPTERVAAFGARPCDVAALRILDRVEIGGAYPDPDYAARRDGLLIVAVECGEPSSSCFCASMNTGPGIEDGFDIRLTEVVAGGRPTYLAVSGSALGAELLEELGAPDADGELHGAAASVVFEAGHRITRTLDTDGLAERLVGNFTHPRWDVVASRCVACLNCTLVCPTCFCTTVVDSSSLDGSTAARTRLWDSCFTADHSRMHGQPHRGSIAARYRQWATHKLSTWHNQFDTPGCVGCGRCITWCPVGIEITEEVEAIR